MNTYQQQILSQNQQLQYQLQHQQHLQQLQMQRMMIQQQHQQHQNQQQHQSNLMMQQQQQASYYEEQEMPLLMAVRVMDGLFVGNAMAAQDDDFLFSNKVSHIVNCAGLEAANIFNDSGIEYLTFPWRDVATTQILDSQDRNISRITKFIEKAFERGECVLVHSLNGLSNDYILMIARCCVVIAAFFIFKYGWTLEQSMSYIHVAHPDMKMQTYFVRQLKLLSKRRARNLDPSDPRDLSLRDQMLILKHTYMNSIPYNNEEYAMYSIQNVKHNRRVIFDSNEHILGPRTHSPDTRPKTKPILKIPPNFVPVSINTPLSLLDGSNVVNSKEDPPSPVGKISLASDPRLKKLETQSSSDSLDGVSSQLIISDPPPSNNNSPTIPTSNNNTENHPTTQEKYEVDPKPETIPNHSYNLRKRPTSFSSNSSQPGSKSAEVQLSLPNSVSQAAPKPQSLPQPKKYRGPTPPKRNQPNTTSKRDNPSVLTMPGSNRSSTSNFNPTQYNYQPSPQDQEPLFLKVNRKPSTSIDVEKRTSIVRSSITGSSYPSSHSVLQGTVSSNLKRGSGAGVENVQVRKRPSSAPKTRPVLNEAPTNSISIRSNSVPTLQSIYDTPSNRPLSAPTANSLNSPRKRKKKKKVPSPAPPAKKEPIENRLMRPTLSFLRKTVVKSK